MRHAAIVLENSANVNAMGGRHGTALQAASAEGYEEIVLALLENGANVNAEGEEYGTALHAASAMGHNAIVLGLLENGVNVDAKNDDCTALHVASFMGHDGIVLALLKNGANGGPKALLENGGEVYVEGGEYGITLQATPKPQRDTTMLQSTMDAMDAMAGCFSPLQN
ncbi:ankyrin repeat-containing domain protein [Mycena olivaceomarginata]|nr:ankyrin repeat-containing domain protein [Mycena olivaceomarginata]